MTLQSREVDHEITKDSRSRSESCRCLSYGGFSDSPQRHRGPLCLCGESDYFSECSCAAYSLPEDPHRNSCMIHCFTYSRIF